MFKYFALLFIPLTFTFTVDSFLKYLDIKENIVSNIGKVEIIDLNSTKINQIYSEKFIQSDGEKTAPKKNKNFVKNIILKKKPNYLVKYNSHNSLKLISPDWQKKFSSKKIKFIKTLLPLIAYENQKILLERKKLIDINNFLQAKKTLPNQDILYLKNISKKYKIITKNKHKTDIINELFIKVDIIPNSIVLSQAANESGWGTSRFAKEYNALFGQYTYDEKSGIVPYDRKEGERHFIKYFPSIDKSVESYFKNINTHKAYRDFRNVRKLNKDININLYIKELINTLSTYAEDVSYVDTLNSIIDTNNLRQFDIGFDTFSNTSS